MKGMAKFTCCVDSTLLAWQEGKPLTEVRTKVLTFALVTQILSPPLSLLPHWLCHAVTLLS